MNTITLEQTIPISKARNTLSHLMRDIKKKKEIYLTKNYKPQAALVDLEYLQALKERAHIQSFDTVFELADKQFKNFLTKKGCNFDTISEKEVNKILMIDD